MKIFQSTLPNGLRVVSTHMPDAQSVSICIFVGAGSRYEEQATNGISHFLEHLFFTGTTKRPSSLDISRSIEELGGDLNAYTAEDRTSYYVKMPLEYAEQGMDTLSDMLTGSIFDAGRLDRERSVIIEEINLYQDDPGSLVTELLPPLVWPDSTLGFTVLGPKENLRSITREQVMDYIAARYSADNMVVSIAGPLDHAACEALAQKYLGSFKKASVEPISKNTEIQSEPRLRVKNKETDQTHIIIALRALSLLDAKTPALRLLSVILGSGMSSRLFQNVREQKGLAYSVFSSVDNYIDTGLFFCKAGVTNEKAPEAIRAILFELKRLRDGDLDAKDLERVQTQLRGGLRMSLDGSRQMANWTGQRSILTGEPRTIEQALAEMEAVTLEQLKSVAREIVSDHNLNMVMVGPHAESDELKSLLTVERATE